MKGDFRVKMKKEILKDYLTDNLDIEKIFDDFYGYVYTIVKNDVNKYITNEDIEEIISDVFIALWKNKENLPDTTNLKAYLAKTAKNIIKNTYRKTKLHYSLSDFENKISDKNNPEKTLEKNEQNLIIKKSLTTLKIEEYKAFIMFYYEDKSIKKIAKELNCSTGKIKVILHRVRKKIKNNLKNRGY